MVEQIDTSTFSQVNPHPIVHHSCTSHLNPIQSQPIIDMADHYHVTENGQLPQTCDIKEALIIKMQELDTKIYMLIKSNKEIEKELKDDPEMPEYLKENEQLIIKSKDELLTILNAFLKSGIDLDKEVYTQLQYRHLWMVNEEEIVNHTNKKAKNNQQNSDSANQTTSNANSSLRDEVGGVNSGNDTEIYI
eukprot:403366795